ncbi:MAG: amidohydrolase [Candidatus Heimdallarchaeota archaeon]|nr:MAG: amidohydrolase [Candidatus Heimdallarchaeota archaeon]
MDFLIDTKWIYYPKQNKLVEDGRILIEGNKIVYSGPKNDSQAISASHDRFNYSHGIATPGFVNAHTHLPEILLRGLVDDKDLHTWLDQMWKYEPNMSASDAYWGSMLGIAEMLASGTVAFNDQYFYSNQMARAVDSSGIKAFLSPSIFYDGNPEANSMEEAFQHAQDTFKSWNGKNNRLWIGFGPHAPYTVGQEWFTRIADEARKLGTSLHTHFNETEREVQEALKKWGKRPVERMEEIGVLDTIQSAAHCIHLSDQEIELLRKHNISVLHCPKSNMKIGAGLADVPKLLKSDVNVCLGTDGQASNNKLDMIEEMAFEVLIHKGFGRDPTLIPSHEVIRMATAQASQLFPKGVYSGTLAEGTSADLTIINLDSIQTTPVINPVSHLTYAIGRENVEMTVVDGTILYLDGEFPTLDTIEIKEKAEKAIGNILDKTESEKT